MSRNDLVLKILNFMGNLPNLLNYKSKKCTFFSYLCSLNKKLYTVLHNYSDKNLIIKMKWYDIIKNYIVLKTSCWISQSIRCKVQKSRYRMSLKMYFENSREPISLAMLVLIYCQKLSFWCKWTWCCRDFLTRGVGFLYILNF